MWVFMRIINARRKILKMENFNLKAKKVLVTGAGGFIGSHLTEHLVELGAQVRALVQYNSLGSWEWLEDSYVKKDIEVLLGDIRDQDCVQRLVKERDIVFHLAALIGIPYSYEAHSSYVQTNILGTLNVLQAAVKAGIERMIHTSTSETYGSAQYLPMDEKHPLCGQSPYAASKIGADMLAESFYRSFHLPVVTLRPFNTYGPRQSARAIIPTIITQILSKSDIDMGSLTPLRDFTFVKDTVLGFVAAASSQAKVLGEVFNLGSGKQISIGELAKFII